jgi:hypothetical protein
MKYIRKKMLRCLFVGLSVLGLTTGMAIVMQTPGSAQPAYGSYVGIGGSFGLSNGSSAAGEDSTSGGVVAVRYRFLEVPISVRAQALISDRTAIVPTVSYDIPLNWYTDAYIGAGVSFVTGGQTSDTSPVGNQTSFVLQPGVDYSLPNSQLVIFGNAIFAFDAYREGGGTGVSLQGGVGLRF